MTPQITIITAALFGMLSVIFGAFGAHALKKVLSEEQLKSFETGVKYQMYHALVLLIIGYTQNEISSGLYWCFTDGLVISSAKNKKLRFLGPVTPLGGLLLIIGWGFLLTSAF